MMMSQSSASNTLFDIESMPNDILINQYPTNEYEALQSKMHYSDCVGEENDVFKSILQYHPARVKKAHFRLGYLTDLFWLLDTYKL